MKTGKHAVKCLLLCLCLLLSAAVFSGCSSDDAAKQANELDLDYYADGNLLDREEAKAALRAAAEQNEQQQMQAETEEEQEETETAGPEAASQEDTDWRRNAGAEQATEEETQAETQKDSVAKRQSQQKQEGEGEEEETQPSQTQPANNPKEEDKDSGKDDSGSGSEHTVTISIRCDTAVANGMHLDSTWAGIVPASGTILSATKMPFEEGDTVFDILCDVRDKYKLHMQYSGAAGAQYIEGINNLYEFDGGRWSGWMYCVNGWYPNYGCGQYTVQDGDVIEWNYTCDLGKDLGQDWLAGDDWKETHE